MKNDDDAGLHGFGVRGQNVCTVNVCVILLWCLLLVFTTVSDTWYRLDALVHTWYLLGAGTGMYVHLVRMYLVCSR